MYTLEVPFPGSLRALRAIVAVESGVKNPTCSEVVCAIIYVQVLHESSIKNQEFCFLPPIHDIKRR